MAAEIPRRGEVRPISDLPDLVGSALWQEVEGADKKTYRSAPSSGATYPDDPSSFGVATDDDEEWNGAETLAERGYTIESDVPAPHAREIDQTFSPSRLRVSFTPTATTAYLSIYRAPTAVNIAGNFALDFDASGAFNTAGTPGLCVGIGVRNSAAAASPGMLLVVTNGGLIELRKYSNIGTGTFAQLSGSNISNPILPLRLFLHLERVGSNWRYGYSVDGSGYGLIASVGEGAPAPTPTLIWLLIKRDAVASPAYLATNWYRWNRYFLP